MAACDDLNPHSDQDCNANATKEPKQIIAPSQVCVKEAVVINHTHQVKAEPLPEDSHLCIGEDMQRAHPYNSTSCVVPWSIVDQAIVVSDLHGITFNESKTRKALQ